MGFHLTTLEITGKDRDAICRQLGLSPAGKVDPACYQTISGRLKPDGAYLIVAMADHGRYAELDVLRSLSTGADMLVCQIHEGCMWSQVSGWNDGAQVWAVEHVSDEGLDHLAVVGTPPPPFATIRQTREARQAAERASQVGADHIFDIAPALYDALTGYRYDRFDPTAIFEALIPL